MLQWEALICLRAMVFGIQLSLWLRGEKLCSPWKSLGDAEQPRVPVRCSLTPRAHHSVLDKYPAITVQALKDFQLE